MSSDLIDPPPTAVAAQVRRLLEQCVPVVRYHSERSYQFAAAFAKSDGVQLDDEVLYLGTLLHDLGLSPAGDGKERFEVRGANVVRTMLLDHGMEDDRVANVWGCIALHASTALARHKSPETRYANQGIALDVRRSAEASNQSWFAACSIDGPAASSPPSSRLCLQMRSVPIPTRPA